MNQDKNNLNQENLNDQKENIMNNNQNINSDFISNEQIINKTQNVNMNYDPQTGRPLNQSNIYNNNQNLNQFSNNNNTSIQYATFGNRFSALLKDCLYSWWFAPLAFFGILIVKLILQAANLVSQDFINLLDIIQVSVPILFILYGQPVYSMLGETSSRHTTKGKYSKNICVLDKNGNYLTIGQSSLRMILKFITLAFPFFLIISIITMLCTEKKQALHDLILGHVVVKNADKLNINSVPQNRVLVILISIFAIIISLFVASYLIISSLGLNNYDKLICESDQGNITLMYGESGVIGYSSLGISYDFDEQKDLAEEIGINTYIEQFKLWFETETTGTCTIDKHED